jgi:hypothetical protein
MAGWLDRLIPRAALAAVLVLALLEGTSGGSSGHAPSAAVEQRPGSFAAQIAALSEPDGYFDTDNLISNERSYLQVIADLRRLGVRGGAYIGVGPDTNFSYIAEVRPTIAFVVDIRRDNLLLHLFFKALFDLSATRVDYLATLLGRPVPPAIGGWRAAPIDRLVAYFDKTPTSQDAAALKRRVEAAIAKQGVPLSKTDLATIARFHDQFISEGLELRFTSTGRPFRPHYPTYRDLLLETDAEGRQANYLASEEAFQFVRSLQQRDLIVPVVGDLSGPSALSAIGKLLATRKEPLSAFYTSNVEFYLFGQGVFPRFVANLQQIPHTQRSVIVRSVFGRYLVAARPGDGSTSHLHPVGDLISGFADGRFRSYGQLVIGR